MTITVDVQNASVHTDLPGTDEILKWVCAALARRRERAELTVRIVDEPEGRELNEHWRHKNGATNVLSFPAETPGALLPELLGDIVICAPIVATEAAQQHKPLSAHWAHMIVHGTLHLLGYDHIKEADAEAMERLEISILKTLGYPNPY